MPDNSVLECENGAAGTDTHARGEDHRCYYYLHQQLTAAQRRPVGVQRMFRFRFTYHNRISRRGATNSTTGLVM